MADSPQVKLVMLGSGGVGKSTLTIQFIHRVFVEEYDPTMEDSYRKATEHNGKSYLVDILDTAGSYEFSSEFDHMVRAGDAFLVVFSVTDRSSFDEVRSFVDTIRRLHEDEERFSAVLVGNKIDLEDARTVTTKEGEALAMELGLPAYVETTAKEFDSTEAAFKQLLTQVNDKRESATSSRRRKSDRSCTIM